MDYTWFLTVVVSRVGPSRSLSLSRTRALPPKSPKPSDPWLAQLQLTPNPSAPQALDEAVASHFRPERPLRFPLAEVGSEELILPTLGAPGAQNWATTQN